MGRESICDFQQAQSLDREHLRRLRTLHEGLAGSFGAALSDLLRNPVNVSVTTIDQVTYGEFISGLETPSCFNLLKAEPLGDRLMLDVEPSILYPMIDRLLGGGHENEPPPSRPLSEIELPLAARITRLFLQQLCHVWKSSLDVDLKLAVLQVESNPRLLRVLPADEMVVLVGFQLGIGDLRGMMRLCLPCRAIRRIGDRLRQAPRDGNGGALVEVDVTLVTTPITTAELAGLQVGDIIATEMGVDAPAVVSIGGEAKFHAKPGVCQGRKAVRLTKAINGQPDQP
jgi:flagellar motor switch protein FliM